MTDRPDAPDAPDIPDIPDGPEVPDGPDEPEGRMGWMFRRRADFMGRYWIKTSWGRLVFIFSYKFEVYLLGNHQKCVIICIFANAKKPDVSETDGCKDLSINK